MTKIAINTCFARLTIHVKELESLGAEDGIEAYNTLLRIEKRAHKLAEDMCNFNIPEEIQEKRSEAIHKQVSKVFGGVSPKGFFINYDPRGYALKIKEEDNRFIILPHFAGEEVQYKRIISYCDWGNYGILAPEFE
jgi:hypothetical protein